ncbi:hypothetical protein [Chloroflexus sp.]
MERLLEERYMTPLFVQISAFTPLSASGVAHHRVLLHKVYKTAWASPGGFVTIASAKASINSKR